jgi:class 3 adenylate cyclase
MKALPLVAFSLLRSIVAKNILLFLVILLLAVVPLAVRYDRDSRDYEIQNLASRLEFFAERGASWIDVSTLAGLIQPAHKQTPAYQGLLETLRRIEREFEVDNAVVMRRQADGGYAYIAIGHDGFDVGERVHIHAQFPATYRATEDTWQRGAMMHSRLFGGTVDGVDYNQFLQINTPLKLGHEVVAILMLNKFANPVAAAVRVRTLRVAGLSVGILAVGLALFAVISSRMLRPLRDLTVAAGQVAEGNLAVALPPPRTRDEIGRLARTFSTMLDGLRQRDLIRDTFGRYLAPEIVTELLDSPGGLRLGGEARVVTLLVSDLRGFTGLAAGLAPEQVLQMLNRYLGRMVSVIQRRRGTIDEIQGDGILAFFGAPLAAPDDAVRAVACALEMQLAVEAFNREQRRQGLPEVAMGIGINTGEVIVGNIGSEQRAKYGAVGHAINVAYRIESYTIGGQILVSPATYEHVQSRARVQDTVTATFKGLDQPVTLYDVVGLAGDEPLSLPRAIPDVLSRLPRPVPVACYPVAGKVVSPLSVRGRLVALGAGAADLALDEPIGGEGDLKIVLEGAPGERCEVYAKALPAGGRTAAGPALRVMFTSMTEAAKAVLAERRTAAARGDDPN